MMEVQRSGTAVYREFIASKSGKMLEAAVYFQILLVITKVIFKNSYTHSYTHITEK